MKGTPAPPPDCDCDTWGLDDEQAAVAWNLTMTGIIVLRQGSAPGGSRVGRCKVVRLLEHAGFVEIVSEGAGLRFRTTTVGLRAAALRLFLRSCTKKESANPEG